MKKQLIKSSFYLLLSAALVFLIRCFNEPAFEEYEFTGAIMGTTYSVKLVDKSLTEEQLLSIESGISESLQKVDALMSTYKETSEVSLLNRLEIGQEIEVSESTVEVLELSKKINELSSGSFDVTVGPLVELWGFGVKKFSGDAPSAELISKSLSVVGDKAIEIDRNKRRLKKLANVSVDLSAIAKGYAVDQVGNYLEKLKFANYLVEVGGEIYVAGHNLRGNDWLLGIETPMLLGRKAHSIAEVSNKGMATSGDYRNFYEIDGVRYSHTIDPGTGYPVKHNLSSVTVIANTAAEADAWATALLVLGEEKGYRKAIENQLQAFFIIRDGSEFRVNKTPDFRS